MAGLEEDITEDAAVVLANWAAQVTFESLPEDAVAVLKRIVLDTLGTTLAANTLGVGTRELVTLARAAGGSPESTIIGFGDKVPAVMAGLVNGGMAHALNFDDIGEGGGHIGVVTVPAALAAAEKKGNVSGKAFVAAVAAGAEVMSRLGLAISRGQKMRSEAHPQPTQMPGYFGAGTSAGRVLGLTPLQMHGALGLAYMQASGGRQVVLEGRPAKAIYAGFSNQGGLISALLSQGGLAADCAVFEGKAGFFHTYYGGHYHRPSLVEGLGKEFAILGTRFKPWPTTSIAHPFIEGGIKLARQHNLDPSAILEVRVHGGPEIRTFCEPAETRRRPRTAVEAGDSILFAVAKALVNRKVSLTDLEPEGLCQPEALRLAQRTVYVVEQAADRRGVVEITVTGGQTYAIQSTIPLGYPARPLSFEALVEKFRDCARYSARRIPPEILDDAIGLIERMELIPDVGVLPALLSLGEPRRE
jgi:2-methylcitrate dehydratase PrpD